MRKAAFCIISPINSRKTVFFSRETWVTGSSITSVALQKRILEQFLLFLEIIVLLLLNDQH